MFYYIYKITNNINGMIYVGVHRTENLGDGYMGSGQLLKRAQRTHGLENFSKEIIATFDTPEEMWNAESTLVNEEFVRSKQTYNTQIGGRGGPKDPKLTDYYNSGEHTDNARKAGKLAVAKNLEMKQRRVMEYEQNPKLCAQCSTPLDYEKKRNKFCSSSCAATYNNTGRVVSEEHRKATSKSLTETNRLRSIHMSNPIEPKNLRHSTYANLKDNIDGGEG